ncbi:MAG: hypothetical protein NTX31_00240 [Burkholderiales bacterium]|jgi:hypothetical protein|nr:hypothetical protein [Burkholderiales bacterium]
MSTVDSPRDLSPIRERFKGTDPAALIVFGVAAGLLVVFLVSVFFR